MDLYSLGLLMKYKVEKKIARNGYPTASRHYKSAHEQADVAEKKKYPVGYKKMQKVDDKISKKELAGTHTKSGKIIVSKKVPKSLRKEVAYHEFVEWEHDPKLCKKCRKSMAAHK